MATEFPILQIVEHGRDGQVIYRDSAGELSFYWEFGGNNVLALINVGTAAEWSRRSPWAVARRGEILRLARSCDSWPTKWRGRRRRMRR